MTLLGFIWTAIPCLLVGFCAGAWAGSAVKILERQADSADPFDVPFGWEREP